MIDIDTNARPNIVGIGTLAREEKLQAAREGLKAFKRSEEIDPGTDTDSIDVPRWVDEFTTTLDDASAIVEKMRLEVTLRFGRQVLAGGDLRSQPRNNLKPGLRSPLTQRQWTARSTARLLAEHEDDVRGYMKTPRANTKGAVKLAQAKRSATSPPRISKKQMRMRHPASVHMAARSRQATQFHVGQLKAQQRADGILTALTAVADGTHYTDAALRRAIHQHAKVQVAEFLKTIRLIQWLSITRDNTGTTFTIDAELRAICDGKVPRPSLDGFSISAFMKNLRAEITRRREAANDQYRKRNWRPDGIHTKQQTELLNWIEDELNRVP